MTPTFSNLTEILNRNIDDSNVEDNFDLLGNSPYLDDYSFIKLIDDGYNRPTILSTNIRSLRTNYNELLLQISNYNNSDKLVDIICLQETWCLETNGYSHIDIPGYSCISKYASCGDKGGLATYVPDSLTSEIINTPEYSESIWENLLVRIRHVNGESFVIGNNYRPPRDLLSTFKSELSTILSIFDRTEHLYLAGDFNLDLLKCDSSTSINDFFEFMCSLAIFPKITLPTRITDHSATLIDNFFCKHSKYFSTLLTGILVNKISDHQPYFLSVCFPDGGVGFQPKVSPVHKRPLNKNEKLKFKEKLKQSLLSIKVDSNFNSCPNSNCNLLNNVLSDTYESSLSPDRTSNLNQPRSPWITKGLLRSINTKNKLCKKLQKCLNQSKRISLEIKLKSFKKVFRRTCNLAKTNYYKKLFEKTKNDSRKMWSNINLLINGKGKKAKEISKIFIVDGEPITDRKIIANKLNIFFVDIAQKITSEIGSSKFHFNDFLKRSYPCNFKFKQVDQTEISKAIDSLNPKATTDAIGISTEIIKLCKFELLELITIIVNQSINTNTFPDILKIARVSAIFKKGDNKLFDNYRPISILPAISKIIERIMHTQILEYFTNFNIFYANQYGFRKSYSTEMATLELIDRIMCNMATQKKFLSVFMDLSKAFDTIDHSILLSKLRYYGLDESAVKFIKSYLSERNQFVVFQGICSDLLSLNIGVPQGSILGPLLFIIYINDIHYSSNILQSILYADDSTFSLSVETNDNQSLANSSLINFELDKVYQWLKANRLCLNAKKTKFMLFSRTKVDTIFHLNINGVSLEQVENFNFLGLLINEKLDWTPYLLTLSRKLSKTIGILKRLKSFVPKHIMRIIYLSLFHSQINYQILAWGSQANVIFPLQKQAIRIINNEHFLHHTDPLFKQSRILKLTDIYTLAQLKFYHKYERNNLPKYLQTLPFSTNRDFHEYDTRGASQLRPSRPATDYSRTTIRNSLPNTVNSLSPHLLEFLNSSSIDSFSNEFKKVTFLSYADCCNERNCYACASVELWRSRFR